MSRDFKFADLGEGITEGELVKWDVKVGDEVKEDQIVAEIETDKAIVEIPSPYSGTVEALHFKAGDTLQVGQVLMSFDGGVEGTETKTAVVEESPTVEASVSVDSSIAASDKTHLPALATPHVRRLAREQGVDLEHIQGTGPGGRIEAHDLDLAEQASPIPVAAHIETPQETGLNIEQFEKWGEIEAKPLQGIRRKIARHMIQARNLTAPVTHIDEVDVSALMQIRDEMKPKAAEQGAKLTYLPFLIRAVQTGLKQYPALNATIVGDQIIFKKYYNIGFAVDTPDGLLVPVLKNVEDHSLLELAGELQRLSTQARERKIELNDLQGSTFTITNLGSIGGRYFTPIINFPDSAILGIGKIYEKPVVHQGQVVIRPVMSLNLTFDHRVTDGATGAYFVNHVKSRLEDPQLLFLDID